METSSSPADSDLGKTPPGENTFVTNGETTAEATITGRFAKHTTGKANLKFYSDALSARRGFMVLCGWVSLLTKYLKKYLADQFLPYDPNMKKLNFVKKQNKWKTNKQKTGLRNVRACGAIRLNGGGGGGARM